MKLTSKGHAVPHLSGSFHAWSQMFVCAIVLLIFSLSYTYISGLTHCRHHQPCSPSPNPSIPDPKTMPKKSKPQTLAITAPAKHESSNTPNLTIQLAIRGTPNPTKPRRDIASEFNAYFGNATNLQNWQRLCHDIGLEDDLPSITSCRQVISPQSYYF
jgi:hypothetical protein